MTLYPINNTFKLIKIERVMHGCQLAVSCQIQLEYWDEGYAKSKVCASELYCSRNHNKSQQILFLSLLPEDNTCLVIYHL